jgi:hypothetical protein
MDSRLIFLHFRTLNRMDAWMEMTRIMNSEVRLRPIRIIEVCAEKRSGAC